LSDGRVVIDAELNDRNIDKGVDDLNKKLKRVTKTGAEMTDGFKDMTKLAVKATLTAGSAFAVFGIKAAADIAAINAQFEQVFGDLGDVAEETVNKMSDEFGILPNRLKPMFSQTTSKFLGLGLDIEDAMKQATTATTLAADGAAFYDKSLDEVTGGLNSFINGSYEGGEAIGLFANETQLAEWASKNLGEEWDTLDEAGKQVIRLKYAEAMYEMSGATGQAARESMTLENQLGNLFSAFSNFAAAVMEPVMATLIGALAGTADAFNGVAEAIRAVNEWFAEHESVMQATVVMISSLVTSLIVYNTWLFLTTMHTVTVAGATVQMSGAMLIATNAAGLLSTVLAFLTHPITLTIMAIGLLVAAFILISGNSDYLKQKLVELGFNMGTVNKVIDFFKQTLDTLIPILKDLAVKAAELGIKLVAAFIDYLPTIIGYLNTFGQVAKVAFDFVLAAMQPMIDKFVGMGTAIKEAFSTGNFDALKEVAATLIPIIIGLFLGGIPKLIFMGYNILNAVALGMGTSVPELLIVIINVITSIITQFVAYLPMIIQVGMNILLAIVNGLIAALPSILGAIFLVLTSLIQAVVTYLPMVLQAGVSILLAIINGIVLMLPLLIQLAVSLITSIATTLISMLPVIISAGLDILFAIIDGIMQVLPQLIAAAILLIVSISNALLNSLPVIISAGMDILLALIDGVVRLLPQLIAMAIMLIIQLSNALIDMLPQIINAGIKILLALIDGLIKTIPVLVSAIPQIIDSIIDTFGDVDWASIGSQIIAGIGSGISSAAGSLWTAAKKVLGGFKDNVLSFFGIHSPSRVFRDEIGKMLPQGMAIGMEADMSDVEDAGMKMAKLSIPDVSKITMPSVVQKAQAYAPMYNPKQKNDRNSAVTNDNGVVINIEKIENNSDSDIPKILEEAAWILSRDKRRLGYE